jgi:broad specificity phosphatase PhoE
MPRSIDLIRHGQSTFNAHWEATGEDPLHFDARLTALGRAQAADLSRRLKAERYDLIVTSPLTRAIETALCVFGPCLGRTPVLVEALHRERVEQSCDVGRPPAVLAAEFATLAFDHLPEEWWPNGGEIDSIGVPVEAEDACLQRVRAFRVWLAGRAEERIAVVGHGVFFHHLGGRQLANCELHTIRL